MNQPHFESDRAHLASGRVHNVEQFNRDVHAYAHKMAPEMFRKFHIRIALEAITRVILRTPVDSGRARGGWQVAVGRVPQGQGKKDKGGGATITAGQAVAMTVPTFGLIVIANNVIYVPVLEHGGYPNPPENPGLNDLGETRSVAGFSRQAPRGMVGITLEELSVGLNAA